MAFENGNRRVFETPVVITCCVSNCRSSVLYRHAKTGLPEATDATGPHVVHRSRRSLSFHHMAKGECPLTAKERTDLHMDSDKETVRRTDTRYDCRIDWPDGRKEGRIIDMSNRSDKGRRWQCVQMKSKISSSPLQTRVDRCHLFNGVSPRFALILPSVL